MGYEDRIRELGLVLPELSTPAGNYVPSVVAGDLIFTSGQIPVQAGLVSYQGVVGEDLTLEDGQQAARLCCLSALAVVRKELGSLDRVKRIVKVNGFVRSAKGFSDQPKVINGASDLLVEVFGDAGRHARAALGVNELPLGVGVEIDFVVQFE